MDLVLYPIHLGNHWCLAAIDNNRHTLSYYDSLGGGGSTCLRVLRKYLVAEHRDKKKSELSLQGWNDVVPQVSHSRERVWPHQAPLPLSFLQGIPKQRNGSDCGVFTCMVSGQKESCIVAPSIIGTLSFIHSSLSLSMPDTWPATFPSPSHRYNTPL